MADVLIVGCGYTGLRLARRLLAEGHRVVGTTRAEERARELADAGVEPRLVDLADPGAARELGETAPDVCYHFVPPLFPPGAPAATAGGAGAPGRGSPAADREADRLPREPGAGRLPREPEAGRLPREPEAGRLPREPGVAVALEGLARAPLACFVYASSTSVYGDRDGAWVDEGTIPAPASPAGRGCLAAERTVLRMGWTHDARPRIARIAGIYGPGRTLRRRLDAGRYHVIQGADAWSNRIHVDDLVTGLHAVWTAGVNGRTYNLCDGAPHRSSDYARFTAGLLGLEVPTLTLEEARERYGEDTLARKLGSKRVSNRRLREELGVELRYPDYRTGVRAALEEEGALPPAG